MGKIYCPNCDGTKVFKGEDWVLIVLGLLAMIVSTLCLISSFTGAYTGDWSEFCPLCQENPFAPYVLVYGLLMLISGSKNWHMYRCDQCGHTWSRQKLSAFHHAH